MGPKLDLKKEFPAYYRADRDVEEVRLGAAQFLTFEGQGAPGATNYQNGIATLYNVAYTLKHDAKARDADFVVPPLEAQYWVIDEDGARLPQESWRWRLLLRTPAGTTKAQVERAREAVARKRGDLPAIHVGFERVHEGRVLQVLHVGPYDEVGSDAQRILRAVEERGLEAAGPHHEVYLSDPRRTAPGDLRTIVRLPVR